MSGYTIHLRFLVSSSQPYEAGTAIFTPPAGETEAQKGQAMGPSHAASKGQGWDWKLGLSASQVLMEPLHDPVWGWEGRGAQGPGETPKPGVKKCTLSL